MNVTSLVKNDIILGTYDTDLREVIPAKQWERDSMDLAVRLKIDLSGGGRTNQLFIGLDTYMAKELVKELLSILDNQGHDTTMLIALASAKNHIRLETRAKEAFIKNVADTPSGEE